MLPHVPVAPKNLDDYREDAGDDAVERLREAARPLRDARLLQINSTAFGGGVAELLYTHIPLLRDLGIEAEWQLIEGAEDFFTITKMVHNGLQGAEIPWTPEMEQVYFDRIRENAHAFEGAYDVVFVHDPQPSALRTILDEEGRLKGVWVWRCHIDLSAPHDPVWRFFSRFASQYDAAVFTMPEFVRPGFSGPRIETIAPSIDPLSPKNAPMSEDSVAEVLVRYGIDPERPVVLQVSRFDPWKDPLGVIDAYRIAKEAVPEVQLVLVGSMANDDPEGWHYLQVTEEHVAGDPDIHMLTNLQGVGDVAVNAFQRAANVVVQKSLREGFGLVVSEALWKEKPVIGGAVGGITLQIDDGKTGYLVDSVEACGKRLIELLQDPGRGEELARAGRAAVRERFLTLRELEDYLRLFASLL